MSTPEKYHYPSEGIYNGLCLQYRQKSMAILCFFFCLLNFCYLLVYCLIGVVQDNSLGNLIVHFVKIYRITIEKRAFIC